jgi:hypothetical protein
VYSTTAGNNTARGAWTKIAVLTDGERYPLDPEPYLGQDAVYLVHGGQYWDSTIAAGAGYENMSPVFMVQAAIASYGFGGTNKTQLSVRQMGNFGAADTSTIEFGYTVSRANNLTTYTIYMATTRSHRPVIVNRLTPFGNDVPAETVTVAPAGIQYITVDRYGDTAALAQRVTALETLINSITVA